MLGTAQFLERLHRGGRWAYLWTAEGSRSTWYRVGKPLPALGRGAQNVFFGVHPTTDVPPANARGEAARPEGVRSQKVYVAAINCVFAEFDAHGPGESKEVLLARITGHATHAGGGIAFPPSVIVDSGGGYHCYWLLSEPFLIETEQDRERADRLQKGWVAYAGADASAKDLARMLRLPGTYNFKYTPPRLVYWVKYDLERTYPLAELEQAARASMPRRRTIRVRASGPHEQPTLADVAQAAAWLDRLAPWRCDEYEPWIEVGMALSGLGTVGLALWDLWSRRSARYEPGVCEEKWKTFTPGEGLTLRSLHYWADEDDLPPESAGDQELLHESAAAYAHPGAHSS